MKKIYLIFFALLGAVNFSNAQNTNPWPSTGSVGIGTTSPASALNVVGGGLTVGGNSTANNTDGALSVGNILINFIPTLGNWNTTGSTMILNGGTNTTIAFHNTNNNRVDFIKSGLRTIEIGADGGWGNSSVLLPGGIWNYSGNVGIGTTAPTHTLTLGSTSTGISYYNTTDQITNYERIRQYWSGNLYTIAAESGGTGTTRGLNFNSGSVGAFFDSSGTYNSLGSKTGFYIGSTGITTGAGLISNTGTLTSSSGIQHLLSITPTISQSSTAGYSALWIPVYENSTGTGSKLLIDAGTTTTANGGGTYTSKFSVDNTGATTITRNVADANNALIINNSNLSNTGSIFSLRFGGSEVGKVSNSGTYYGSGFNNYANSNNAAVTTNTTGTTISRNVADANPVLTVIQNNALSTGNLLNLQANSLNQFTVSTTGVGFINNKLGIGTASPSYPLDVNGAGRFSVNSPDPYNTVQVPLILSNAAGNQGTGAQINFQLFDATSYINSIIDGPNHLSGSALTFGTPSSGTIGTERMRITSNGNVGIGTASPSAKLTVSSSTSSTLMSFQANTGNPWSIGPNVGAYSGDDTFGIYSNTYGAGHASFPMIQFNGATGNTTLNVQGGNVGIGTNAPAAKLELDYQYTDTQGISIIGGGDTGTALSIGGSAGDAGASVVKIAPTWNTNASPYALDISPSNILSGSNTRLLNISLNGSSKMIVTRDGLVGIGTATPDAPLTVNGRVHSKEVYVDVNIFPDYVFKPSYHLPSLTEVKTYIDKNHHLPDMPTEAEVAKKGLNLGETESLLTKKVEELTLYLIDLKKSNDELKAQNATLKQAQQKINKKLSHYHLN